MLALAADIPLAGRLVAVAKTFRRPGCSAAMRHMRRCLAVAALILALASAGCTGMDDTTRRTATGAGVGATGGYLHDWNKRREEKAYLRGIQDARHARH